MEMSHGWAYIIRVGPRFGLSKPVPILVAHLLINIKKKNIKVQFIFFFNAKSMLHCVFQLKLHKKGRSKM
jgi:hypothetical protein